MLALVSRPSVAALLAGTLCCVPASLWANPRPIGPSDDAEPARTDADAASAAEASDDAEPARTDADEDAAGGPPTDPASAEPPETPPEYTRDPRPPLPPPIELPEPPAWERRVEVGGAVVFVSRPLWHERPSSAVSYHPGVGFGLDARWDVFSFLRVRPYFYDVHHEIRIPRGGLTTDSATSISADAVLSESTTTTFAFGLQIEPTWWITDQARAWLSAGVGWGRFEFPEMTVQQGAASYTVRERSSVFVEFPLGLGAAYDVIPRWLAVSYHVAVAPVTGHSGNALEPFQAIDADGNMRDVGSYEPIDISFIHTLSLALIL